MSQPIAPAPKVNANIQGTVHQVNLRDYLNVRVAPFLKKAIHESLDAEAQYPLQWLGEHLIQQSILFEGNPDATNLRERFAYNHDPKPLKPQGETLPAPQTQQSQAVPSQEMPSAATTTTQDSQPSAVPAPTTTNGMSYNSSIQPPSVYAPLAPSPSPAHDVNGTSQPASSAPPPSSVQQSTEQDTEMSNAP